MTGVGRHRKPRHLTYFDCPNCTTRVVVDLDAILGSPWSGAWEMFGVEPDLEFLPEALLAEAETLVERHEHAHLSAAS